MQSCYLWIFLSFLIYSIKKIISFKLLFFSATREAIERLSISCKYISKCSTLFSALSHLFVCLFVSSSGIYFELLARICNFVDWTTVRCNHNWGFSFENIESFYWANYILWMGSDWNDSADFFGVQETFPTQRFLKVLS